MNESCHTDEWVTSSSCHTQEWEMSRTWMYTCHVARVSRFQQGLSESHVWVCVSRWMCVRVVLCVCACAFVMNVCLPCRLPCGVRIWARHFIVAFVGRVAHMCVCCVYVCVCVSRTYTCRVDEVYGFQHSIYYGVATVSRLDKITGLFCRISSLL